MTTITIKLEVATVRDAKLKQLLPTVAEPTTAHLVHEALCTVIHEEGPRAEELRLFLTDYVLNVELVR